MLLSLSQSIVIVRDLVVTYGRGPVALDRLTLTLPGGATGLLGRNGAGKTSLILALLGLIPRRGGEITIFGYDPQTHPLEIRARLGYAPDRDAWIPDLDAVSAVAYCAQLAGLPAGDALARAHDMLFYVGLGESRYRPPHTFSTGMRQRLKLAQALVHDPELLILDEPTDGMDPQGRERMLRLLHDVARRPGRHLMLSTHILGDVERVCDHFVLLDAGRVIRIGRIADARVLAERIYDVEFRGDRTRVLAALSGAGVRIQDPAAERLAIELPDGDTRALFVAARAAEAHIRYLKRRERTLDDIVENALSSGEQSEGIRPRVTR